jgi:DDE superfamily endonuclease
MIGPIGRPWSMPKSLNWYQTILPNFDAVEFKKHFRVCKPVFQKLCVDLQPLLEGQVTQMRDPIPVKKKIHVGLFHMGSAAELRVIAQLFGIGLSTVHSIHHSFTEAIIYKYRQIVKFPTTDQEFQRTASEFATLWDYPFCIGALDGCHIPCSPKKTDAVDYYNFKGWYSTVLFAVCDARYRFTYFKIGSPGRVNDGFIFRHSNLKHILDSKSEQLARLGSVIDNVEIPLHIIADSAFPLLNQVMKPFPHVSVLSEAQKQFNFRLSRARRVIENAFGRLKLRFRYLLKRIESRINVNETIHAAVLLHNLCEENMDEIPVEWFQESASTTDLFIRPNAPSRADRSSSRSAVEIRNALAFEFNHHRLSNK